MARFVSHPLGVDLRQCLHHVQTRINIDDGQHPKIHRWSSKWKSVGLFRIGTMVVDCASPYAAAADAQARVSTAGKQLKGSLSTCQ